MKKFLSLVLALVMTMSLVTISAGAKDFTDNSKITYKEAVDVVSEIGIVDGYEDGAFNPTNTLTRGAAAKIICNLILGPTTADALRADTAPYKDVPTSNTFAGYIAYCQQQGIISGYADGTFRPAATLTGYAFMKMLLGALGYDSTIEGYVGANWSVQVGKTALGIGLDDGNDNFVGTQAVTREEACLYTFNTLKATMVEYGTKTTVEVNGATVNVGGGEYHDVVNTTSTDGNIDGIPGGDDKMQFAERYFTNLSKTRNTTDAFGRPANEWRYRSVVIGSYADYSDLKASYTAGVNKGDLYTLVGSSIVNDLGDEYELNVYVDGEDYLDLASARVADFFVRNSSATAALTVVGNPTTRNQSTGRGVLTEVFVDDDSNVTIVMVNTYLMQATADYNSTRESVTVEQKEVSDALSLPALPAVLEQEDFDVSAVKENDYLLVTYSYDTDEIESVDAAEIVTGTVTQYTETSNVIMDGTTYRYAAITNNVVRGETFTINAEAALVMDAYGYIIYVDDALSSKSFVYIKEFGNSTGLTTGGTAVAYAYFTDGTESQIKVENVNGVTSRSTIAGYGLNDGHTKWYTYTADSNDNYTLTDIRNRTGGYGWNAAVAANATNKIVSNSTVRFTNITTAASSVRANANTIFMVLDTDEDVTVYTGVENVPDITLLGGDSGLAADEAKISWTVKDGYAEAVFIDLSQVPEAQVTVDDAADSDFLFVLDSTNNRTVVAGSSYYEYDVLLNGEETTRFINSAMAVEVGKLYYNYRTNSNNYITSGNEAHGAGTRRERIDMTGATIDRSGQTLSIANKDYVTNSNTNINVVVNEDVPALLRDDGADYETYVNTTLGTLAGLVKGYAVSGYAYVIVDEAGSEVAETIYIWINGATQTVAPVDRSFSFVGSQYTNLKVNGANATTATKVVTGNTITFDVNSGYQVTSVTGGTLVDGTNTGAVTVTVTGDRDVVINIGAIGDLPDTSELSVTPKIGGVGAEGRYNNGKLTLRFNGLTPGAASSTITGLIVTEAPSGGVSYVPATTVAGVRGQTYSDVVEINFTPKNGTTGLTLSGATVETVNSWFMSYGAGISGDATVANTTGARFTMTVSAPANAATYDYAVTASDTSAITGGVTYTGTGVSGDIEIIGELDAADTAPGAVSVAINNETYAVNASMANDALTGKNGLTSVVLGTPTGNIKTGTGADVPVYVVLGSGLVSGSRLRIEYTVNGTAATPVNYTTASTPQFTVNLPVAGANAQATVVVTSVEVQSVINFANFSSGSPSNLTANAPVEVKLGENVLANGDYAPLGATLDVTITVAQGSIDNDGVEFTISGNDTNVVSADVANGSFNVTGTHTVTMGTNAAATIASAANIT